MTGSGPQSIFRPHTAFCRLAALLCVATLVCAQAPEAARTRAEIRQARTTHWLAARLAQHGGASARALEQARRQHTAMLALPRATGLSAPWTAVGPAQITSPIFGALTGRLTSIALDPADVTGNTVYLGTTGGGVWKSTNAAGPAASVTFTPLTDTLPVFSANAGSSVVPSLSIGAVAMANGVLLAGTGDPNDATDSYYGAGILRSADAGLTWTLIQTSNDGAAGLHDLFGLAFAGFAFSSVNPSLVVAATSVAEEGALVNAPDAAGRRPGLYSSSDAGLTWHLATIQDGSQVVESAAFGSSNNVTAVVWNPIRQLFFAAVQYHGFYQSPDGSTWTRMAAQPGAALTAAACPAASSNPSCPLGRAALAVQPVTGDLFALTVDSANRDQGLFQDVCALRGTACSSPAVTFATQLASAPLETGSGSNVIPQAAYNLVLAAAPAAADTVLYAGTIDLYRCTLAAGCTLRNTTNAENGCLHPAGVAPAQHALALLAGAQAPLLFLGNDGGLYRSTDGVAQTGSTCSAADAAHFDNLNPALGSLAEVVAFAQDPVSATTLLAGLGALGTAGTGSNPAAWPQLSAGEGGTVAIDQTTSTDWYLSNGAGVSIARCAKGAACSAADFASTTIGEPQVANDVAAIHAPFLLDPAAPAELLTGTCRAWRGPAANGALWSASNAISRPFGAAAASACSTTFPVVNALAAAGPLTTSTAAQDSGSSVLYAGLAGTLTGGGTLGGHVFTTAAAGTANASTIWTDAALSPVTNDTANAGQFNPGGFEISSLAADPHDATGKTVYATLLGFSGNSVSSPRLYRSADAGAHWTAISANLPDAPVNSVVVDPNDANTLYVALDTGVYVTTQVTACASTNCWSAFGSGLPNSPAMQLLAAAAMPTGDGRIGELRVGTYGRGIWQIPLLTAISPAAPAVLLAPSTVTFAAQQVGTQSAPVTVSVTNTGNAPLIVSSVVPTGDFTATDTCVGSPVAQGASCSVQVRFAPTASGSRTGLLTVYANIAGGQATAALSGTGTPPATIVLTPTSLSFAATTVGVTSGVQNITIANTGGNPSALASKTAAGDFRVSANTCAATLAPQNSCTVSIVFTPPLPAPATAPSQWSTTPAPRSRASAASAPAPPQTRSRPPRSASRRSSSRPSARAKT